MKESADTANKLPPYPFPGLDPDVSKPDEQKVINAEISLRLALKEKNKGITQEDAETLLKHIVYTQRQALKDGLCDGSEEAFKKKYKLNNCIAASFISKVKGAELSGTLQRFSDNDGYKIISGHENIITDLHSWDFLNSVDCGHAFAVAVFPVRKPPGDVVNESYLIDTTFRQFFDPEKVYVDNKTLYPGHYLVQTPEGREMADALLKQGYIRQDREKARLYLNSLAEFNNIDAPGAANFSDMESKLMFPDTVPNITNTDRDFRNRMGNHYVKKYLHCERLPRTPLNAVIEKIEADKERGR